MSLFCQKYFKCEQPLSTKRVVCWCRDHGYAPSKGSKHIQVPPTPHQVIRPASEEVDASEEDAEMMEKGKTGAAKASFSSERELIASLEPTHLESSQSNPDGHCRYCGKPLLESAMVSHYKRCSLKPIRMQLTSLPTAVASKARALPSCKHSRFELERKF